MSAWQKFWRESHPLERAVIIGSSAAIIFFGGYLLRAQSQSTPLPPLFQEAPMTMPSPGAQQSGTLSSASKTRVIVHVVGAVAKPGVEVLPASARVADAIRAAGGATKIARADALNLAAHLEDGQQIRVLTQSEIVASTQPAAASPMTASGSAPAISVNSSSARSPSKKSLPSRAININTASPANLTALPGIGPALAARIAAYRSQHGRFNSVNDLDNVSGIGPKKLEKLRPYIIF